jgi:2-polyprenyl-3-methyl-5-hydroxy-6-metoxy-1,4-benzoquinol methylase
MSKVCLEDVSCPLGCKKNDGIILVGRDLIHEIAGEFTVVKCKACGLIRTTPRPTPQSIGLYYPDDYGPYIGTRIEKFNISFVNKLKRVAKPLVNWIFDSKEESLPKMMPGSLLEVGCASGSFLQKMAEKGWQVQGIEFSEKAAQSARDDGHLVFTGSLEQAPAPNTEFDLIAGWMVLEHLHDPINCLKKLNEWASPSTWLVLSVPNADTLEFTIFGDKWYALQLPTHLYHFTPKSIEHVLNAAGWRLIRIQHQRTASNLFASMAFVCKSRGWAKASIFFRKLAWPSGVWFYILFPIGWILSIFGQSGRMVIWARK